MKFIRLKRKRKTHFLFKTSILEHKIAAVLYTAEVYILSCQIGSKGNILFKGDLSRMYQATLSFQLEGT